MGRILRLHRDERGATAVVVGVSLVALVGALMLSVDAGNMWAARRTIITGTDATALAEARTAWVKGSPAACGASWTGTLESNAGTDVEPIACAVQPLTPGSALVRVEARKPYDVWFGGIFGIGDGAAYSMSAAKFAFLHTAASLRPIGVCVNDPHVANELGLVAADTGFHPAPGVHRIFFTKSAPTDCGEGSPGNWGWQNFNGGSLSNAELVSWLRGGYGSEVGIGDCDADGTPGDRCPGDAGSSGGSVQNALQKLVDDETEFGIIVYDQADGVGANAEFNVLAFLGVVLKGFKVTGAESERYFDFEFRHVTLSGRCCAPTGLGNVRGLVLCGVDHDPLDPLTIGARCAS